MTSVTFASNTTVSESEEIFVETGLDLAVAASDEFSVAVATESLDTLGGGGGALPVVGTLEETLPVA